MLFKGNSTSLQLIIEKLQSNKESTNPKDTLGTEGGSSWASETTSPGSSCATPNSAVTEAPESELSFTVGATDATPHSCRFCEKAFPRQSYLKKHEQTHADCMPFRCEFCRRLFKHKRSRDRHIKLHTGDKKYKCDSCEAAFSRSDHLKIHSKTHDQHKPFPCTICNRGYNTAAALTSHMQNHKKSSENSQPAEPPGTSFRCLKCPEVFRKPQDLQNHTLLHESEDAPSTNGKTKSLFPTRLDTKESISLGEAQGHPVHKSIPNGDIHRDYSSPDKTLLQLPVSGAFIPSPLHISPNQKSSPSGEFFCDICYLPFTSASLFYQHNMTVHNFYKEVNLKYWELFTSSFYCSLCLQHFNSAASYTEHFFTCHNTFPPNQWLPSSPPEQVKPTDLTTNRKQLVLKRSSDDERVPTPKKKTKVRESLTNHPPNTNNHQNEFDGRPLECSQCFSVFLDFESFRAHQKLHIENKRLGSGRLIECERPPTEFACPSCGKKFSSSEEISHHVMTHYLTASTAFSCDSCQKSFERKDDLQKHQLDAHSYFVYSCKICNDMFDSKGKIQIHFVTKHSNELKVFKCSACPPTMSNLYHSEIALATHIKNIHINVVNNVPPFVPFSPKYSTPSILTCVICNSTFPNELDLRLHLATHGKQFHCTLCPQSFQIEYLLDKHMQSHHSTAQMNGTVEQETRTKEGSPIILSHSRLSDHGKALENGETKVNSFYCDSCEKADFASEMELLVHKKVFHHKSPSPRRISNDNSEAGDDRIRTPQKHKTSSSTSSSPVKKMEIINGDPNGNSGTACEICEKKDFANEAELQSHKKLIHHVKLSSPGKVSLNCAYCKENCKSRTDLENHMKSHSQNSIATGKHKCIICDEIYPTAAVLAEHKLTHCKLVAERKCMHCKGTINSEEEFIKHTQQHSTTNGNNTNNPTSHLALPTVCIICRQTLVSEMEARLHAKFHLQHSADLMSCSVCFVKRERQDLISGMCRECYQRHGKASPYHQYNECHTDFESDPSFDPHMANIHKQGYTCMKCKISFTNEKDIQRHLASHMMIDRHNNECRLCHRVFQSATHLQTHLIEHSFAGRSTFSCYHCVAVFPSAQGLQAHVLEHGLTACQYECSRCGQKFFFNSELEHHNYIHLEEIALNEEYFYGPEKGLLRDKPPTPHQAMLMAENLFKPAKYNCTECSSEFHLLGDLIEHRNRFHGPAERFMNGEQIRPQSQNGSESANTAANTSNTEVKIEPKKENECESEDEQIDVVTTKVEEDSAEQNEN